MHSPDIVSILEAVHVERTTHGKPGLEPDLRMRILADVVATLDYIEKTPHLKQAHERSLTPEQVDAGIAHYANELANGRKFDEKDPFLTNILTITPVAAKKAPPSAPPAPRTEPLTHLLRDPGNMRIFREEVTRIAASQGEPGQKAAHWIAEMLRRDNIGEPGVIKMFEDMKVLTSLDEKTRPSQINASTGGVKQFVSRLSGPQKSLLKTETRTDERNALRRTVRPVEGRDISRRFFLTGAATAAFTALAYNEYGKSVDKIMRASTPKPDKKQDQDNLDFFAEDQNPLTQKLTQEQIQLTAQAQGHQKWALGYAGGAVAFALPTVVSGGKLVLGVDKTRFRGEVGNLLARMDHVVAAVKDEIRAQGTGAASGIA